MQRLRFGLTSNNFQLRNQEAAASDHSKTCKGNSRSLQSQNGDVSYKVIPLSDAAVAGLQQKERN